MHIPQSGNFEKAKVQNKVHIMGPCIKPSKHSDVLLDEQTCDHGGCS